MNSSRRRTRGADDVIEGRVRLGGRDILANRPAEEEIFLQDHAKTAAKMRNVVFADVDAVDLDHAFIIRMQALQQARHGRLARSASPDHAERRPDRNLEADVVERRRQPAGCESGPC